nr:MAG: hypothetical protein 2 [Leviviridae sp.]
MPAVGTISILDNKGTPVAHVFTPQNVSGAIAKFTNTAASIPAGRETLSVELATPVSATAAYRLKMKYVFPTIAAVNSVDTVVRTSSADLVINFSQSSTLQERKDTMRIVANSLLNASVMSVGDNLETIY